MHYWLSAMEWGFDMSEAPELKPCPFCGGEAHYQADHTTECRDSIWCRYCDYGMFDPDEQGTVATQWNTRADNDKPRVKPLIFTERPSEELPDGAHLAADCSFGRYFICNRGEYGFGWKRAGSYVFREFVSTENKAKAAAQADYEARVLGCLDGQGGVSSTDHNQEKKV